MFIFLYWPITPNRPFCSPVLAFLSSQPAQFAFMALSSECMFPKNLPLLASCEMMAFSRMFRTCHICLNSYDPQTQFMHPYSYAFIFEFQYDDIPQSLHKWRLPGRLNRWHYLFHPLFLFLLSRFLAVIKHAPAVTLDTSDYFHPQQQDPSVSHSSFSCLLHASRGQQQ